MTASKKKLLYFTNNDSGRDVEMMLPVLHFAKRFLNCEVEATLTPNLHEMFRLKPDCVVIGNTIGALLHFHIARAAHASGIPVFTLVSEGNFKTDGSFDFWGYNTDRILYEQYLCCWSERTLNYMLAKLPEEKDRIVLTGGPGFDRYKFYDFATREEVFKRHGIKPSDFKRFIGYAGWGFGKLTHPRGRNELLQYFNGDIGKFDWAEEQRTTVEGILRQAVEDNPETLFILKKHPTEHVGSESNTEHNEMAALREYPNVLYLLNEHIHDLINIVDLWWVYESTTAIEADIMNKQTLFVVPDGNFPRIGIHRGFPEARNYSEVKQMTEHFFEEGTLPDFHGAELVQQRNQIVRESIGFADGYNHIRAAYYLKQTLELAPKETTKAGFSLYYFLVYWTLKALTPFYSRRLFKHLPWLKKKLWVFERYKLPQLPELEARYSQYLDRFYKDQMIEERYKSGTLFEDILPHQHSQEL